MFSHTLEVEAFLLSAEVTTNRKRQAQMGQGRVIGRCVKSWERGIRLKDTKADEMLD